MSNDSCFQKRRGFQPKIFSFKTCQMRETEIKLEKKEQNSPPATIWSGPKLQKLTLLVEQQKKESCVQSETFNNLQRKKPLQNRDSLNLLPQIRLSNMILDCNYVAFKYKSIKMYSRMNIEIEKLNTHVRVQL